MLESRRGACSFPAFSGCSSAQQMLAVSLRWGIWPAWEGGQCDGGSSSSPSLGFALAVPHIQFPTAFSKEDIRNKIPTGIVLGPVRSWVVQVCGAGKSHSPSVPLHVPA